MAAQLYMWYQNPHINQNGYQHITNGLHICQINTIDLLAVNNGKIHRVQQQEQEHHQHQLQKRRQQQQQQHHQNQQCAPHQSCIQSLKFNKRDQTPLTLIKQQEESISIFNTVPTPNCIVQIKHFILATHPVDLEYSNVLLSKTADVISSVFRVLFDSSNKLQLSYNIHMFIWIRSNK